jgi:hypothetical protein
MMHRQSQKSSHRRQAARPAIFRNVSISIHPNEKKQGQTRKQGQDEKKQGQALGACCPNGRLIRGECFGENLKIDGSNIRGEAAK